MNFAAWMEVWLGDRWWTFDPRNNRRRKGRILIGQGRDASDVAMVTAVRRTVARVDDGVRAGGVDVTATSSTEGAAPN